MREQQRNENVATAESSSFWEAAYQIIAECYAILKPNGIAVEDGDGINFCDGH